MIGQMFLRDCLQERTALDKKKSVFLPFFQGVSHNLKAVGLKFDVSLVFQNDCRLSRLTPFEKKRLSPCPTKHNEMIIDSRKGVMYEISLTCGFTYIRQTGTGTEHRKDIMNKMENSEVSKLLPECNNCLPLWNDGLILELEF